MSIETKKQSIREIALELGEVHALQLEAWEATKLQATALAEALYGSSGLEPPVPPEQWDWRGTDILGRLLEACDDLLSRMLQPQQGGDAAAYDSIRAAKNILISASNFKPGMSRLERLTEFVKAFYALPETVSMSIENLSPDKPLAINHMFLSNQDGWQPVPETLNEEPEKEAVEPRQICGVEMRTNKRLYKCDLPMGHGGRHGGSRSGGRGPLVEKAENIEVRFEMENDPPGSLLIRMMIDVDQRATARASKIFNRISREDFQVSMPDVVKELKSALLDLAKGKGERTITLSWKSSAIADALYVGRILSRKNDHFDAYIVHYNMSDGTSGPPEVPEHIRESFRRTIHEILLKAMSKLPPNELSPADIEKRLAAMREHYGFSDAEVVAKAVDGTIPADPDYCEWLVLLGRSDLIRT